MPDVHDTPLTASTDRMHVMNRSCWCQPEVWRQFDGDDLIVHNEIAEVVPIDRPHFPDASFCGCSCHEVVQPGTGVYCPLCDS